MPFTDLACMVNTHMSVEASDVNDIRFLTEALDSAITAMYTKEALEEILTPYMSGSITRVTLLSDGTERGLVSKQIHNHFNLSVEHTGRFSIANVHQGFKRFFDGQFPWMLGCYVHVRLAESSRLKNYNQKHGRAAVPDGSAAEGDEGSDSDNHEAVEGISVQRDGSDEDQARP